MSENKTSAAQLRAAQKYKREKVKRVTVELSPAEAGLWEHIQGQPNKQGYIKGLIRADMETTEIVDGECTKCRWFGDCIAMLDYHYCPGCGRKVSAKRKGR